MKQVLFAGIVAMAFAACATTDSTEQTGTEVRTLTSDFGEVIVVGAQLPSGDNFAQAFLPDDLNNPVATYQFMVSSATASWSTGGLTGSTTEIPMSESLETANWMAYEVWAAGMGIEIGDSPYGCQCGPCGLGSGGVGVCCKWKF